jgi:hypothetical protein
VERGLSQHDEGCPANPYSKTMHDGETPSLTRRATLTVIVTRGPGQMNRKKKSVVKQKKVYRY